MRVAKEWGFGWVLSGRVGGFACGCVGVGVGACARMWVCELKHVQV